MCLMPLNCTLKTVKMVNFTLCIFCYSKKFKDQDYILTQNKMFRNVQNETTYLEITNPKIICKAMMIK